MNNEAEKRPAADKLLLLIKIIFAVLMILALLIFVCLAVKSPHADQVRYSCVELDGFTVTGGGTKKHIELPYRTKIQTGAFFSCETVLPDTIGEEEYLCLSGYSNTRVYVGGELRDEFKPYTGAIAGTPVKSITIFVKLLPSDAGKVLKIERAAGKFGNVTLRPVYVGTELGIVEKIVSLSLANLILTVALLIISLMAIIIGIILRISKKMKTPITTLGIGVLFASLWLIFDSQLFQFVFRRYYIDGIMSFVMIFLIPFPFMYYLNILQEQRYERLYTILSLFMEGASVVCMIVHFTGTMDFLSMMPVIGFIEGVVIAGVLYTMVMDFRKGIYQKYFLSFIGVGGMALACFMELVLLQFVEDRQDGSFIIAGLYWTIMLGILHQLNMVREAQQKAAMAVRASETKTNFLANMSHEIRTPMNAILGMDEMILRESGDNPRITKYAQDIRSAGNMLLSIINGILDLSKIESGKAELVELDFDIIPVIIDIVNIIKRRASDKNLTFSFNVTPDIPSRFHGDETRIRQVMLNIINNAVKYTSEGSVRVTLDIDVKDRTDEKITLILTVKDTGIGIREEDIGKLFQPFDRLEQTKNRNIEGTGLGLNIASTYVNLMGGNIDVESVYGEGSKFKVRMPVKVVDPTPVGDITKSIREMREADVQEDPFIVAPGASVLVIDDNEMNLEVIAGLLERTRMRVDAAASGFDGIALMRKRRYDIILLDQMMPGLDGISTLKKMRTEFDMQGIPVIALTADAVTGAREYYLENGFDDYLSKPVKTDELEAVLIRYLPPKLVVFRDHDSMYNTTTILGTGQSSPQKKQKTMLAVDADMDNLKRIKEKTSDMVKGTFVTDMDKARRFLDKHDVDYVVLSREVFSDCIHTKSIADEGKKE